MRDKATNTRTATYAGSTHPSEPRPLAAQAPPEALPLPLALDLVLILPLTFRRPPHAAATRPRHACAATRTGARSCTATTAGRQRHPDTHHPNRATPQILYTHAKP